MMCRKHAVLVALVAATWLAIAGVGLLLWAALQSGPNPASVVSGAVSLGAAALMVALAIWSRPR